MKIPRNIWKGVALRVGAVLFSLLLIFAAEGLLRIFSYGKDLDLFVRHSNAEYRDYLRVNPHVGEKYFSRFEATTGTNDIFLKKKPEDGFRLFVLGSSTMVGFPYDRNLMASRILHRRLEDAFPGKNVEVVNTAITAVNSITLRDFLPQILKQEPDAILIYAGHNEYYGAFGVGSHEQGSSRSGIRTLNFKLMNLRLVQLLRNALGKMKGDAEADAGTLMKRMVRDPEIAFDSPAYHRGLRQYEENMGEVLAKAYRAKVPVLISTLVSNEADLPPFHGEGEESSRARKVFREAGEALYSGDSLGARMLFSRARDLDPVRFRAPSAMNVLISRLAEEHGALLLPTHRLFEARAQKGTVGYDLLTEHVHPNVDGQFLLAESFFRGILESKVVGVEPDRMGTRSAAWYRMNWPSTRLDELAGEYVVRQLMSHWPYTAVDNPLSFRDTFRVKGMVETQAFSMILTQDKRLEDLHAELAQEYELGSSFLAAAEEYRALAMIHPYRYDYLNQAALALLKLEDLHAAEYYLRRSLRFVENSFAHRQLGEISQIKGDRAGARASFQAALSLLAEEEGEGEQRARVEGRLRNLEQMAPGPLRPTYASFVPADIAKDYHLAMEVAEETPGLALQVLNKCLASNDCPLVNRAMGNLLYQMQDPDLLYYYRKAYPDYRWDPSFLAQYVVAHLVNRQEEQARVFLGELKSLDPDYTGIPPLEQALAQSLQQE